MQIRNRFIQADWRVQLLLQFRMLQQIMPCQGLFEHQQIKTIELAQAGKIRPGVGAIGIGHQRQSRTEAFAQQPHNCHLGPGLDFNFDPAIAPLQRLFHLRQPRFRRRLHADGDAGRHCLAHPTQPPGQR